MYVMEDRELGVPNYSYSKINADASGSSYHISSLNRLEESASNLEAYNQQITNNANSIAYIIKAVRENWQNEEGQDIESILVNLNDAVTFLTENIQPIITTYVGSLNKIVEETRVNQNKTFN